MDTTSTHSSEISPVTKDIIPSVEIQNLPEPDSNNINATSGDQENHDEIEMPRGFLTNSIRDTLYSFIEGFSSAKKKKASTLENVEAVPMQGLSPDKTITIEAGKTPTKEGETIIQLEEAQVQPEFISQEEFLTKEKEFEPESENKIELNEQQEIIPAPQPEVLVQENIEINPAPVFVPVAEELPTETIPTDNNEAMEIINTETHTTVEPTLPLVPQNSNVEVQASAPSQNNTAMEIQNVMTLENLPSDETIEVTVEKTTVVTVTYEEQTIPQQIEESPKSIEEPQTETVAVAEENIQEQQQSKENSQMIEEEPKQITPPQTGNKSTEMYNASSERVKSLFRDTVASASKRAESLQKSQSSQKSQNNNLQTIQPKVLNMNQAKKPAFGQRSESLAASKPEQKLHKIELKKKTVTPNVLQPKNSHDVNLKKRKAGDAQIGVEDNNQLKKMKMNNAESTNKSTIQQQPGSTTVLKENNPNNGPKKVILKPTCVYCGQGLGDKKNVQMLSCLHKAHTKCYASSEKKKSSQCPACNSNSAIGGKFELLNSKVMPRTLC